MKMASMRNHVRAGVLLTLAMVVTLLLVLTHATPALSHGTSTVGVSDLDEPAAGNTSMVGYTSTFHDEDSAVSFCNGYSNTDSYGFSVDENTSENTVVGTVAACEPHGDSLTYFVGGTDVAKFNEVFDLNASTGEITVKSGASIDYEGGKRSYSLTVTVTDAEDSSDATVPMSITVINVDEPGTVTLSQATPGVGSALRPTLDDPDGWVVLFKVQWSRADTADGPFTLLNFRYISSLRKASYTPETADEGKFLKVTLFYIDRQCRVVNSYNNQCRRMAAKTADNAVATAGTNTAPVFSSSNVSRSIAENTAAGQNVGTAVTATDADAGDTLGYTLGGADAASFDFVESSGQIRTKTNVSYDFEAKSSYTVTVTASDGTATAVATVTIGVTDVDEPPSAPATPMVSAVSGSTTSLSVSWAAPANAGKPAIASYDVQYRVGSSGAWSDGPEDVAGTSTTITSLVASTDYEARVRATNAEGDSGWSDPPGAGRTNTPTNNAPVFSSSNVSRSIAENTAAGQNVGTAVTATDADAGDTLGYTLGGADAASFDFVESSGQIRTKTNVSYDFEAKSSYTVTVTASDGTATAVATVTIGVTDVDEPPSAPATPMVSAVSGSTTSLSVSWVAPANAGKPAIASYDVQYRVGSSGAWSDGPEDVAGTSTTITSLVASTDYEARVRATNAEGDSGWSDPPGAGRTNTPTNNAPVFSSSNVSRSIAENTAAGQNVGTAVTATDADAGDTLGYTLGGADAASFDFVESSGQIRTKTNVSYDFEAKSSYTVTVTASDGTATAVATVTIGVTDVDEPPSAPATPMVSAVSGSTTSLSVSWAAPANAGKPAIASYDVQYRVGSSGAWSDGPEDVAGTSTTITSLVASTDYEARVRATNAEGDSGWSDPPGAGRTNTPTNNAPVFSSSNVSRSIAENTAAGQNVGTAVTATDADAGDTLGYTLGGADAASFDFVESSGQIRTKTNVSYDFEAKSSYTVTVTASDGTATAVATVTIGVTDVDEPPSAPATPMVSAVSGSTTSLSVSWVAPANAGKPAIASYDVQYRVGSSGAWSDGPEDVAGTSTTITSLVASTDYEARVRATNAEGDSGWSDPPGAGRTNTPTNNAPVFSSSNVSRSIAENTAAGQNVGTAVTATDADAGDTLGYTLGGADAASFDFVESSGQIRTKTNVSYDFEAKSSYTVTVTASDGTATAVATVTIGVTDVDEPPSAPATPMVSAVSGSTTSLSVSWVAPANAGKPAIASYDVQYRAGSSGTWIDGPEDVTITSTSITSLATDTAYQARVRATNAEGDSGWSDPPGSGRTNAPGTSAPGAPGNLGTTPGDGRVTLAWTAPGSDGGAAILKYQYRAQRTGTTAWTPNWTDVPDGSDSGGSAADETTFTVSGLTNGTEYRFEVHAVNSVGAGAATSAVDTPRPPLPPGSGFLVGNFGQPADGAAQISLTHDIVGAFKAGALGATLDNIEFRLFAAKLPEIAQLPSATLYRGSVTATRATTGTRVATLTAAPGSPRPAASPQTIVFAAPGGTRLDADTTYLVVLTGEGFGRVESTTFPAEDAGGASGWAIDGVGAGNSSPYAYETTASLRMRVNGTAGAPALTVSGIASSDYAENGTTSVATYAVADAGTSTITWSLSGDDSGDFSISSAGVLSFSTSPDYESPADADTNNVYRVRIQASDGTSTGTLDVTVTVTDANEAPMLN